MSDLTATQAEVVARIKAHEPGYVAVVPVADEERARVVAELQANPYKRPISKCEHAARLAHDMPMSIRRAALQWGVSPGSVANTYAKLYGKRRSST